MAEIETGNFLSDDEILDVLTMMAPVLQKMFPLDTMVQISDTEKFLAYMPGREVIIPGDVVGTKVPPNNPIYQAMQSQGYVSFEVPREDVGISFKACAMPVKNKDGQIIGGLGMGFSLRSQNVLLEAAQNIAASAQAISATTEEMASSASILANTVEHLMSIQNSINDHLGNTDEILGMIKSIADSSKMLGINAAIEAAHAGEHGRGFSVVAEEIRKMGDDSLNSVKKIRNMLEAIKENLSLMTDKIMETAKSSQNQAAISEEISATVQDFAKTVNQIEEISRIL
ncbi:MAG: chemotaxis protein [Firmicutes bacterium]|nr:chemotaxis protein [Bacillota bacterium]